ncbi:GNAT family N-acetyltransferase [Oleiharenicola lentus]|uniref:GNAT family N-acetyltransferase n=1 Tax=Oleiharenicola lentus TaxID=2508720 RepID=UPI003F674654
MLRHVIHPGLELRQLQPSDAPALFAVVDAHRTKLRTWLPWVDDTKTLTDSQRYIATTQKEFKADRVFMCGIWSMGQLVGCIGHNRIDWANRVGFPAYWLAPSAEGQGLMTLCCRAVNDHAFRDLKLKRVVVAVATENHRAKKIPLKLGYQKISTLKKAEWLYDHFVDHEIYSLSAPN